MEKVEEGRTDKFEAELSKAQKIKPYCDFYKMRIDLPLVK